VNGSLVSALPAFELVLPELFSTSHDYPVLFALAFAGAVSVLVWVVWGLLRAYGDIYEEYCNLRRRCSAARRRLREEIGSR
jgi:hypothetical protein